MKKNNTWDPITEMERVELMNVLEPGLYGYSTVMGYEALIHELKQDIRSLEISVVQVECHCTSEHWPPCDAEDCIQLRLPNTSTRD